MQHRSLLMPSLIQQIDDIVNKAATRPPPPLPSTPSLTLIVNIVNQAAARPPLPSTPSLTSIVDTSINKAATRRPQPPPLPSTPLLTASKSRHVYALAVLFNCRQQTIQISEVAKGNHKSTSSNVVLVLDSSCISSIPTWITILLQVLHLQKKSRSGRKEGGNTPISTIADSSLNGRNTSEEKKQKVRLHSFQILKIMLRST